MFEHSEPRVLVHRMHNGPRKDVCQCCAPETGPDALGATVKAELIRRSYIGARDQKGANRQGQTQKAVEGIEGQVQQQGLAGIGERIDARLADRKQLRSTVVGWKGRTGLGLA